MGEKTSMLPPKPRHDGRAEPNDDMATSLAGLWGLLRPHLRRIIVVLVLLMTLTGVNMVMPLLWTLLVDGVLIGKVISLVWLVIFGYLGCYVARNLLYFWGKSSSVHVGEHVAFALRRQLFDRFQQMNLQFYKKHNPAEISTRVMNDSFVVQSFIQDDLPRLLQSLLLFLGLVAALYAMNWRLALVATAVLPIHLVAASHFKGPIKLASREVREHLAHAHSNLIEKLLGAEVVKGFTAEQRESEAFAQTIDSSRRSEIRSRQFHVRQKVVGDLLVGAGTAALIGAGALHVVYGTMTPGLFIAFFGYVMMLYPNVLELMSGFAKLARTTASIDRVMEVLDVEQVDRGTARPLSSGRRGNVEFRSVSFGYDEGSMVLKEVNLSIRAGQVCAIVGPSGSGKSTLVKLVPKFLDATDGSVLVDGVDVQELDVHALREGIGMAFQGPFLFESSILENLRYAHPDATILQVIEAAQRAGAHSFIQKLPSGYDTRIGEHGTSLSRGEMQRLCLSRAMLKNPSLLILDEATVSIDTASQEQIIPAILEFMAGKTTLMITPDPELLKHADTLVELVDGQVVYEGPIEESNLYPQAAERKTMSDVAQSAASDVVGFQSGPWGVAKLLILAASVGVLGGAATSLGAADPQSPAPPVATSAAAPIGDFSWSPPGGARFVPVPGLNRTEIDELADVVLIRAQTQLGYVLASDVQTALLGVLPAGVVARPVLVRGSDEGVRLLRVGYKTFRSQPPHIYIDGRRFSPAAAANDDLTDVEQLVADARSALEQHNQELDVKDLAFGTVALSYIEADRCLGILKGLGYQCLEYTFAGDGVGKAKILEPNRPIDPSDLPAIMLIPGSNNIDLVGGTGATPGGPFGMSMTASVPRELPYLTSAAPIMELMVLYHPARPEQFSKVLDRIRRTIDLPARQIFIEAMVLEISEAGLEQLGVRWELQTPFTHEPDLKTIEDLVVGRLPTFDTSNDKRATLELTIDSLSNHWRVLVEALVRSGSARIISRPKILTLDNRQASLRVGEEVPVAKSLAGDQFGNKVSFDFSYIPIGILLNVRPRVSADSEDVSMQVDAIVSMVVPGQGLAVRDVETNQVLASAPRISTRRVQAHTRIPNNTPIVIGGLVSRDETIEENKIPLLGDIPVVGALFRSSKKERLRREVIIVITPTVLYDHRTAGPNMPEDDDAFDSFDHDLFRDAYRIRAEDVFELDFLVGNRRLREFKRLANLAVRHDFRLGDQYPFNRFVDDRVPGEWILVYRQMYEVIKRLELAEQIDPKKLIFFDAAPEAGSGIMIDYIWERLSEISGARPGLFDNPAPFFRSLAGRALAMTYTIQQDSGVQNILTQPVPRLELVDCPDRKKWGELLWDLNQPDNAGRERFTILLHQPDDVIRLKRAIMLKHLIQLNYNQQALALSNFSVGRLLRMPRVRGQKFYLIDEDIARCFFYTEQYYPALQREMARDLEALHAMLRTPEIRAYLDETIPQTDPSIPLIDLGPPPR